ncbi:MAG: glycosyltransferase, partial [Mesorhizobium sp.]
FPSRTDTFGNVIIEALASGTPVAAYPVTGPIDIVGDGVGGAVSNDLGEAAMKALNVDRAEARQRAMRYSWTACAEMFLDAVDEALGMPSKRADQDRVAPGRPRLVLE